ncbi:Zn-ribbon domain-containing OB-fold protein [Streptomyces sp. NPDC059255]|uniref:Zn-ribbon domain-containing OB-fold protein n=1 Tax=Streptomyces sp. NPDC059255 TaxID=3346793 RepID=UPI0036C0C5D2
MGPEVGPGMAAITEPYYEGLVRGELMLQHCKGCDRAIMYPRHLCPFCHAGDLDWVVSHGRGVLHSFTVQRLGEPTGFAEDTPYALGVVKLSEGVQLLGRLWPGADGGWDAYTCDAPVEFRPAAAHEARRRPVAWFGPVLR